MASIISFEALGYRDVAGRLARRTDALALAQREEMRTAGRVGVDLLKRYAPKDTDEFAQGIRYRTDETGRGTRLTFYVGGPHAFVLPFLIEGTIPHEIPTGGSEAQLAKGYPLHWISESGEDCYAWSVWHPGTEPDPFLDIAKDSLHPHLTLALRRIARRVIWLT